MKSLLSILTAFAFVFVAFAGPGLAGDEKKTSGGATSGTTGATGSSSTTDDKGAASPKSGADQGSSTAPKSGADQGSSASPKTGASQGSASPSGAGTTADKPANKDECNDNGWQKFGFKDQAECVASVAPEKKTQ